MAEPFNDPDAGPEEDAAFLKKIAGEVSKRGRPKKKAAGYRRRVREEYTPLVRELIGAGWGWNAAARMVSGLCGFTVTRGALKRWVEC